MNKAPTKQSVILLFGGSFNPPHRAHLAIAHAALDAFSAFTPTQMQIIPSGQPWQKPHVAPAEHRLAMLRLAINADRADWSQQRQYADYPIQINTCEVKRDQASYTVDTLHELRRAHPNATMIWIMGSDQLSNFHTWREWRKILDYAHIAVTQRAEQPLLAQALLDSTLQQYFEQHHCDVNNSAWRAHANGWFIVFPAPALAVSSTQIRQSILHHQQTPELIPAVRQYIDMHRLYQE